MGMALTVWQRALLHENQMGNKYTTSTTKLKVHKCWDACPLQPEGQVRLRSPIFPYLLAPKCTFLFGSELICKGILKGNVKKREGRTLSIPGHDSSP